MKLELKHLAGYLDGGLKAEMLDHKIDYVGRQFDEIIGIHKWSKNGDWCLLTDGGGKTSLNAIKPILRNISDLTKEIEHNGEKFVPIEELLKMAHETWYTDKIGTRYSEIETEQTPTKAKACFSFMATKDIELYILMPWNFPTWITNKLLEWKFDISGLIENNLAVAVTDEFNPYKLEK